jgi:predicted  nucleic acid-binding Zn-ribbon protein
LELAGVEESHEHAVILDFESIRITEPGKYELDLVNLFGKNPLVYKLEEGKYVIDLSATFNKKSNLP